MCRLLLILLMGLPVAAWADDDRSDRRVQDPDLQVAVNRAIDAGVAYLKKVQQEDGSWTWDPAGRIPHEAAEVDGTGGLTALALYALAASRVPSDDPAITRGLDYVRENPRPFTSEGRFGTYSASLLVLALTRIDPRRHRRQIRHLAETLAASQLENQMWTYRLVEAPSRYARPRGRGDPDVPRASRRPPEERLREAGDNSNSQFAVLALWAAQEIAGVEVEQETWKRVLYFYATTQLEYGAWGYHPPARDDAGERAGARHTMIAAGLVSYVYALAALHGGTAALEEARASPAAVLGLAAFRRRSPAPYTNYYLVYSVERVGTVLGRPTREWYDAGARALTRAQRADGSWPPEQRGGLGPRGAEAPGPERGAGHGDRRQVYETALALLFLSRATAFAITPR